MTTPRIEVDLSKIRRNTRTLVNRLAPLGIAVVGVTKGVCGHPQIARAMLDGGVAGLGDARISNVEGMRAAGIRAPITMIRTPMLSQVDRVVRSCTISLNTEISIIEALSDAACRAGRIHQIILMVEMGDGREGLPPAALLGISRRVMGLAGVSLAGLGANFACLSCRAPKPEELGALAQLAAEVERDCGVVLGVVSGGNSANLTGAMVCDPPARINQLRLGESILLGRDPLTHRPLDGLATDAFALVAEVIETALEPWSPRQDFDALPFKELGGTGRFNKSLVALGDQDTETRGLSLCGGVTFQGSTSDHLVLLTEGPSLIVGSEIRFQPDYSALMRAMSAPDVAVRILNSSDTIASSSRRDRPLDLELA